MGKVRTFILAVGGTVGALLMFAASIPYEEAKSNISSYLKPIGIDNPPDWLTSQSADDIGALIGLTLFLVALVFLILGWSKKLKMSIPVIFMIIFGVGFLVSTAFYFISNPSPPNKVEVREEINKWAQTGSLEGNGEWDGNVFVYYEPHLLFTKRVTVEDNGTPFILEVDPIQRESFINWKIEIEKAGDRVQATIDFKHGKNANLSWENAFKPGLTGGIRLPEDRLLSLVTNLKPETIPVIISVYMTSYEIQ